MIGYSVNIILHSFQSLCVFDLKGYFSDPETFSILHVHVPSILHSFLFIVRDIIQNKKGVGFDVPATPTKMALRLRSLAVT